MALLEQLLMEGVRNYSPEIKPWNASGFLTNANQVGNMNEKLNEIQRQNSIRNLIAQRESEGIPFDRLANEAAKYDLQKAISMQDAGQKSLTFNRQELDARLASHKKTMAGWLGGEVLRRAQQAVAEGNAKWDFDYVVNVCNEAASVIFPYDPQTAMSLMSFGKQGLAKKATDGSRNKFTKDHELEGRFLSAINTNIKQSSDPNADPNNYDRNTARYHSANRLMEWKANNPYTERNLEGRQLWSYMIDGLLANARKNKKPIGSYTDEEISALFPEMAEQGNTYAEEPKTTEEVPVVNNTETPKKTGAAAVADSSKDDSSKVFIDNLTKVGRGGRIVLDEGKTKLLQKAINDCVSLDEINGIKETLSGSPDLEKDNSTVFKRLWDEVAKKEKEIKEAMGEADNATYEDLMKLKKLVGSRNMNSVLVKSLRNFVNAMSGYTTTDTPYTSVTNWILVTQPDYKYINDDIEMAKTLRTNNKLTNVKSILAKVGPFESFRELMSREVAPDVMYAMAKDGTNAMKSWWKGISKGKSAEQIENIKLMYSNMFGIDDDFWPYIEGKVHVPTPKEAEEEKKKYESDEANLPSMSEFKKKQSNTTSADTKYTKESWDNF